jgi:predicted hydrocarbon binding protein
MDRSTDGVTLYAGFVLDVLSEYAGMERSCAEVFAMAEGLEGKPPNSPVPMKLYNDVCDWIEKRFGAANIRQAGRAIGSRVYDQMVKFGGIDASSPPPRVMEALKQAASTMIQDPKKRGWEIVDTTSRSVVMRRTQTFNCPLQEGLLLALIERTDVVLPRVTHPRCERKGAEYCEYEVRWTPKAASAPRR